MTARSCGWRGRWNSGFAPKPPHPRCADRSPRKQEHKMSNPTQSTDRPTPGATPVGQTPYSAWIQTDTLHSLHRTVSDHPGEHAWITHVQVSELYWMLIIKEMQSAQRFLRADD